MFYGVNPFFYMTRDDKCFARNCHGIRESQDGRYGGMSTLTMLYHSFYFFLLRCRFITRIPINLDNEMKPRGEYAPTLAVFPYFPFIWFNLGKLSFLFSRNLKKRVKRISLSFIWGFLSVVTLRSLLYANVESF